MAGSRKFAFDPPPTPTLEIAGTDALFPVHRIYCVGRNYAEHAVEMGHDPDKEPPFFFQKNSDTLVPVGKVFPYPSESTNVHHEIELVVALSQGGDNIPVDSALNCVFGYAVGLDMTRRELQEAAKKMSRPWEVGKAFEYSAPCGHVHLASDIGHPVTGAIGLKINGQLRQAGDLNQMIWKIPEIISYLSKLFTLRPGDLIFTGTPAGVGPVQRGDLMSAVVEGVDEIEFLVA